MGSLCPCGEGGMEDSEEFVKLKSQHKIKSSVSGSDTDSNDEKDDKAEVGNEEHQNKNGEQPVEQNGNGKQPVEQNGNGEKPVEQNGNGEKPVEQNENGEQPVEQNENGAPPVEEPSNEQNGEFPSN